MSCQTPEISWPGYSFLFFLAIESLMISLVDYLFYISERTARNFLLVPSSRPSKFFGLFSRSAVCCSDPKRFWMNSCNSQRFLIFLRQTSKLQRLHRVNDHNSHYIPKTFSPHNAKWVVSLRQLERFTEDFAVQLPYLTHRLISDTLQTSFAQFSFLGWPLFTVFNSLRLATPLIFFCLSNEYSTRHFFARSLADIWQADSRGCYPFAYQWGGETK